MINPLRYRSVKDRLTFEPTNERLQCWKCRRDKINTPAFFLCHECGNANTGRPYCKECFSDYHTSKKKEIERHTPHPIVKGVPVTKTTLVDGDGNTFAKTHDWVTLDYTLTTKTSNKIIENTISAKQPLIFQSGCSGPCIHVQLLGCNGIAATDVLGFSNPCCAVLWKNEVVGATTTKYRTLNPRWTNQTFVIPLDEDLKAILHDNNEKTLSATLNTNAPVLPRFRVEVYDWDRLSKNNFLGQACISDADLLRILRRSRDGDGTNKNSAISVNLRPKLSRGKLGIRAAIRQKKLLVHIVRAENVPNVEPVGISDPYCEVYWNGRKVGKTAHADNTLDPVWNLEIFVIEIGAQGLKSLGQSTLRVVCLDFDQHGNNDVLGQIELQGWQVEELAQSVGAEEAVCSREEGFLPEADAKQIQDVIRNFQMHELGHDGCIGKLVVRVPQDPAIVGPREAEAVDGVAEFVGNPSEPREDSYDIEDKKGKAYTTRTRSQVDRMLMYVRGEGQEESSGGNVVKHTDMNTTKHFGQGKGEREIEKAKGFARGSQHAADVEFSLVAAGSSRQHPPNMNAATAPWDETAPGTESKAGGIEGREIESGYKATGNSLRLDVEELKRTRTSEASFTVPRPLAQEAVAVDDMKGDGNDLRSIVVVDVRDAEAAKPLTEVCSKHVKPFEPGQEKNPSLSMVQDSLELTGAVDLEEGRRKAEGAKSEENRRFSRNGEVRTDKCVRYRDARVLRFEEDRGVLLEYMDDNCARVWMATKFIHNLQIKDDSPTVKKSSQNQLRKLLLFWKHTAKRKALLEAAMAGSPMQWYQLELTDKQSGADFVRGSVDLCLIYHTRGTVLRGLDIAVSQMSLGERARIEVRPDFGFGEVYAARNVPPYSSLVFVAEVIAIERCNAKSILVWRAASREEVENSLFRCLLSMWSYTFVVLEWFRGEGRRDWRGRGQSTVRVLT